MKLHIQPTGPVGQAFRVVAAAYDHEIMKDADAADEVLCTNIQKATDFLLAGKRVELVLIGKQNESSVEALMKNERFREKLTIFHIDFTENDSYGIEKLIRHWGNS